MLASQMIYTGCGKYKNAELSTWSRSADITANEEREIRESMLYIRPTGLPDNPTKEQLALLFPKKFSYFYLASGRVCMAQSVYIGRFYSDSDKRFGNYMIHAFVFDKSEDLIPMDYIESNLFKRELTYEEWHEQDAPDELPKIEIGKNAETGMGQDINAFFLEGSRTEDLRLLLQAIMNALDTEEKISFYAKPEDLKYWYKAVSICLPKPIQKKLTLDTYYEGGLPPVKIRNFNITAEEAKAEKYGFHLEKGIFPSGTVVTNYVRNIVDIFLKNGVVQTEKCVEQIWKISGICGVNLDIAFNIFSLWEGPMEEIGHLSESELRKAVQLVKEHYDRDVLSGIADKMYEYGVKSGKWTLSKEIAEIYQFIFDYSDAADKNEMIHTYIVNQEAFGVDTGLDCDDYCSSFQDNAPFAREAFLDYLFASGSLERCIKENGTFNSIFLIFHAFAESIPVIESNKVRYKIAINYIVDCLKRYIREEQRPNVLSLLRCLEKYEAKFRGWIIERSYGLLRGDGGRYSDVCSREFTLKLAESCGDMDAAKSLVFRLISENEKDKDFIKLYVEHHNHEEVFYKRLDADIKLSYAGFLDNVKKYEFEQLPVVTKQKLQEYYDEYFTVGKDDEVFPKKLRQYLFGYYGKERISESLNCYQAWVEPIESKEKAGNLKQQAADSCRAVVCEAFDSSSIEVLREYILQEEEKKIKVLRSVSCSLQGKMDVIICGEGIKKLAFKLKRQTVQDALKKIKEEAFDRIPTDDASCGLFIRMYLKDVFDLYFALTEKHRENYETVFYQLFFPIHGWLEFGQFFYNELNKRNEKQYGLLLCDAAVCVCCLSNRFHEEFRQFIVNIFEITDKGKRKKLFAQMSEQVSSEHKRDIEEFSGQWKEEKEQKSNWRNPLAVGKMQKIKAKD